MGWLQEIFSLGPSPAKKKADEEVHCLRQNLSAVVVTNDRKTYSLRSHLAQQALQSMEDKQ